MQNKSKMSASSWDREFRQEVVQLLHVTPEDALLEVREKPHLQPFFREIGNQFLNHVVVYLQQYLERNESTRMDWSTVMLPLTLGWIREGLQLGANPYFSQCILLSVRGLKGDSTAIAFLRGCIDLGVDPRYDESGLLCHYQSRPEILRFLLEQGLKWDAQCSAELARGNWVGTLEMLCRTGRIFSCDDLLQYLYNFSLEWNSDEHMNAHLHRLSIIMRWAVPIPMAWLIYEGKTPVMYRGWGADMRRLLVPSLLHREDIHIPGHTFRYYIRAYRLVEYLPNEPALRHLLAKYIIRPVATDPDKFGKATQTGKNPQNRGKKGEDSKRQPKAQIRAILEGKRLGLNSRK